MITTLLAGELNRLRDSGKRVTYTANGVGKSFVIKSVIHEDGKVFLFYTDYAAWTLRPDIEVTIQ